MNFREAIEDGHPVAKFEASCKVEGLSIGKSILILVEGINEILFKL